MPRPTSQPALSGRPLRAALAMLMPLAAMACGSAAPPPVPPRWVATWLVAQQDWNESLPGTPPGSALRAPVTLANQTVRQVMHVSLGGTALRIQLSNRLGAAPVTFAAVHVALGQGGGAVDPATDNTATFAGQGTVTLAAGDEKWSDDVALTVPTHADVAVSLYVAATAQFATVHLIASQTAFVAPGDQSAAATLTGAETRTDTCWLAAANILHADQPRVVVAFGDSLTDGAESTLDANQRWPNQLDTRLQAMPTLGAISVVNAGIGGNRWLNDFIGPRGADRFGHDVLGITGATHTVILMGINDIGVSTFLPVQTVTAEQIEAAIAAAVTAAQAKGLKVAVATLLPFAGSMYFTADGEVVRQSVNTWIRASQTFFVVDLDSALRDPAHPDALRPDEDSGDHLHLNDGGYKHLAESVDLAFFAE